MGAVSRRITISKNMARNPKISAGGSPATQLTRGMAATPTAVPMGRLWKMKIKIPAMARKIINAHNGSISVDSHPGKGTSFSISLPLLKG